MECHGASLQANVHVEAIKYYRIHSNKHSVFPTGLSAVSQPLADRVKKLLVRFNSKLCSPKYTLIFKGTECLMK